MAAILKPEEAHLRQFREALGMGPVDGMVEAIVDPERPGGGLRAGNDVSRVHALG